MVAEREADEWEKITGARVTRRAFRHRRRRYVREIDDMRSGSFSPPLRRTERPWFLGSSVASRPTEVFGMRERHVTTPNDGSGNKASEF